MAVYLSVFSLRSSDLDDCYYLASASECRSSQRLASVSSSGLFAPVAIQQLMVPMLRCRPEEDCGGLRILPRDFTSARVGQPCVAGPSAWLSGYLSLQGPCRSRAKQRFARRHRHYQEWGCPKMHHGPENSRDHKGRKKKYPSTSVAKRIFGSFAASKPRGLVRPHLTITYDRFCQATRKYQSLPLSGSHDDFCVG